MNWKRFFRRDFADAEQQQELEFYLDLTAEEYIERGIEPGEARATARKKLGNTTLIREEVYQMNTVTFVEDVVAANVIAMDAPGVTGQVFNVARGQRTTVNGLLEVLQDVTDVAVDPQYAPSRPGEVRDSLADVGRARSVLGWEPQVELREGLLRTVEHCNSETRESPASGGVSR